MINEGMENFAETERMFLRKISPDDLEPLARLIVDPEVMEYSLEGPLPCKRSKEIIETMIDNDKKYGFGACAVINKTTGAWMGFCSLWLKKEDGKLKTDFGYRFFKEFWGQGYATESVSACLQYITKRFPYLVINSYIEPDNKGSLRVAEKVGMIFVKEGVYHNLPVYVYRFVHNV